MTKFQNFLLENITLEKWLDLLNEADRECEFCPLCDEDKTCKVQKQCCKAMQEYFEN